MNEQTVTHLCQHYGIGEPIAAPEQVTGGLIHRMYRFRTTRGEFAVKALNPNELKNPGARARYRLSERIAASVVAAGLPAVAALEVGGDDTLLDAGQDTVLIYPWVEGWSLGSAPAGPDKAALIGSILGRIHALPLHFAELGPPTPQSFAEADWMPLAEAAGGNEAAWADELRAALPDLTRWGRAYAEAQRALEQDGVWTVSHADLHQQNVLWSDEHTPWLIDWESAGLQQPVKEAVVSALEWSGFVEGDPDIVTFRAFLDAYRRESPLPADRIEYGLHACYGNWLGWLHFNVRRALGIATSDSEEQALGARQTVGTLATIRRVEASFPALMAACRRTFAG